MNSRWRAFLESRSARIDDAGKVHFPDAPAEADCALVDLSHLGLIAVSGPEAQSFLQGQLTIDVPGLSTNLSQLGSHCSHKGRMLASFRLFKLEDTLYMQLPRTKIEATIKRLRMFLLRADATIEDASDQLIAIAVAGECAPSLLQPHLDALPVQDNELMRCGDLTAIRVPGPVPRLQVLGPATFMETLWDRLSAGASIASADFWALLDIRAGIPTVYPETSDAFVPQTANLHLLNGVSFTKGCYTGQEVVARMQYLGKLKRRMYLAQVKAERTPVPGEELHCPTSTSEQATGRVVDARANGTGDFELLVVVEIKSVEHGEVRLGSPDGPRLVFSGPPYDFEAKG